MPSRRSAPAKSVVGEALPIYPIDHLSYSTVHSYFECPKKVQLAKERRAPAVPAWWFAGGSAVHATTEAYDRWSLLDPVARPRFQLKSEWEKAFDEEVSDIASRFPDKSTWRAAGSKDTPETYIRWKESLGPELVASYIRWRQRSDWSIWHSPQGEPGIELDIGGQFPGSPLAISGYLDRVFVEPLAGQRIIVDLKTGTRQPDGPLQFGVYNAGMILKYDAPCRTGYAFMNRKGELSKPHDLIKYTPEYVGRLFGQIGQAVQGKIYPAHTGGHCRMCDVSTACYAQDGEFSSLYDEDDPDFVGRTPF